MKRELLSILLLGIIFSSCLGSFPDPHSLQYQEKEFNELARSILDQYGVYEMDDFTRYYKSLNDISIKLNDREGDQNAMFLEDVVDSLQLDAKKVSALRDQLEQTKLREFIKSADTILFTVDGFLDDSWGFMYCQQGLLMDSTWFNFKGNSVKFVEDINRKWKRAAIR